MDSPRKYSSLTSPVSPRKNGDSIPPNRYIGSSSRGIAVDNDTQTELVLYPDHNSVADRYSHIHAESYRQLEHLRAACANSMTALGGTVYDMLAFKDLLLQLEERLPSVPMNDLLLLTSKLYRETGDLSRLLQAFFQNVFSDGYTDDIFHFTDTRLLKMELAEARQAKIRLQQERDEAVNKYDELSRGLHKHAVVVKSLEDRNDALELRSSALEDQMALLFSQLADDFVFYNEELLEKTSDKMAIQQSLVPARSAFSQSVETINKRLVTFQNTLNDIYNDSKINAISEGSGNGNSVKSKLKQLDQNAQHMIQRFSAVKDGLMATSEELVTALKDKKRIINFSLQHIKLFDVQSTKLRASRALMHEIRQRITTLERTVSQTLINGATVAIDRNGDITSPGTANHTISSARIDNGDGYLQQRHVVRNVKSFQAQLLELQDAVQKVTSALDTTAEQKAMLKTISLSTPSTGRAYGQGTASKGGENGAVAKKTTAPDAMQLLTTLQSQYTRISDNSNLSHNNSFSRGSGDANNAERKPRRSLSAGSHRKGEEAPHSSAVLVMMRQLKSDYVSKLDFVRSVYEGRIAEGEEKIDSLNSIIRKQQAHIAALNFSGPTNQNAAPTHTPDPVNPAVIKKALGLVPSIEGGWKNDSANMPLLESLPIDHVSKLSNSIYLLESTDQSSWHRLITNDQMSFSNETWLWNAGTPLELFVVDDTDGEIKCITLGPDVMKGHVPQITIPARAWRKAVTRTEPGVRYSLLSRISSPESHVLLADECGKHHLPQPPTKLAPVKRMNKEAGQSHAKKKQEHSIDMPDAENLLFAKERWVATRKDFFDERGVSSRGIIEVAKASTISDARDRISGLIDAALAPMYEDLSEPGLMIRARSATNAPKDPRLDFAQQQHVLNQKTIQSSFSNVDASE